VIDKQASQSKEIKMKQENVIYSIALALCFFLMLVSNA
jgi:hypothetical protein